MDECISLSYFYYRMDQDLWLKALNFHGGLLLQSILSDEVPQSISGGEKDKQDLCNFISKRVIMLFIDLGDFPDDFSTLGPEIPIIPIEIFRDASLDERRDIFYKCLDRGHILILRVINDTLPDNYKLLVLCKQENYMKLDDLSLIMFLPKLPAELELAGGNLESNDLIRAAVNACSIDERRLYVTLDSNILEEESENAYLGKITEKDLPFYLGEIDPGPSYVEYLSTTTILNEPTWLDDLSRFVNLEPTMLYSFRDGYDSKIYHPCVYANELREKQIWTVSDAHYGRALNYLENDNLPEALKSFNEALNVNPRHIEALVSRGSLYAHINDPNKAFKDIEAALSIDPTHENASKQMSLLLVPVAKAHMENNNLIKAKEALVAALFVDNTNEEAVIAYEELLKLMDEQMDTTEDKAPDESEKTSEPDKTDKVDSCDKSDNLTSKKDDSKEEFEGQDISLLDSSSKKDDSKEQPENQAIDLEATTRKFLASMQKKLEESEQQKREEKEKEKKSHRAHHKSQSKSPRSSLSP